MPAKRSRLREWVGIVLGLFSIKEPAHTAMIRGGVWLTALVLALIGLHKANPPHNVYGYVENWYRALELLTVQMPHQYPNGLPLELQIARFALPLSSVWFAVGSYLDLVRRPFHMLAVARKRGHLLVCGKGKRAEAIARQAMGAGREVVLISDAENTWPADLRTQHITGDFSDAMTFRRANIGRAAALVAADDSSLANVRIAIAAHQAAIELREAGEPQMKLVVECDDLDLTSILDGSFADHVDNVRLRLVDPLDTAARAVLPRLIPALGTAAAPGAVLMIGCCRPAQAVLLRVLRNAPDGFALAVVDANAAAELERLRQRFPGLPGLAAAIPFDLCPGPDLFDHSGLAEWFIRTLPGATVVDAGGEEAGVAIAMQIRRFCHSHRLPTTPVLVREAGSGAVLKALRLMDNEVADLSRIYRFGALAETCTPEMVLRDGLDALARRVHDQYQQSAPAGDGNVPWENLRETYRNACRAQADHLDVKLAAIGCRRVVDPENRIVFALSAQEVEQLAELEHLRWSTDRLLDGWRYGPVKDPVSRTHPSLVPYARLPEAEKELDRCAVRNLPGLARAAGFAICREFAAEPNAVADGDRLPVIHLTVAGAENLAAAEAELARGAVCRLSIPIDLHARLQPVDRRRLNGILDRADSVVATARTGWPLAPDENGDLPVGELPITMLPQIN